MTIDQILKDKGFAIISVSAGETLAAAAQTLDAKRIGAVVALDDDGSIVGVLSERDIVRHVARQGASALNLNVGDDGMKVISLCIANGSLPNLKSLFLTNNYIGDTGMTAFADALRMVPSVALANLEELSLSRNLIGDTGMMAFAKAIKPTDKSPMGPLASLKYLKLGGNKIGDVGMETFADAIASGAMGSLLSLNLAINMISDVGMVLFARAIKPTEQFSMGPLWNLTHLLLSYNQISDEGMRAFSEAISSHSLPNVQDLMLNSNQIGDVGMIAFEEVLCSMQKLERVLIRENPGHQTGVTAACRVLRVICG